MHFYHRKSDLCIRKAAVILAACFVMTGFAGVHVQAETSAAELLYSNPVWDFPEAGIRFDRPDAFLESKGTTLFSGGTEIQVGDGVTATTFYYVSMPKEEVYALFDLENPSEEDILRFMNARYLIESVFGIDAGRGEEELTDYLTGFGYEASGLEKVGEAGDTVYFARHADPELDGQPEEEEYAADYLACLESCSGCLTFYEPENPYAAAADRTVQFETTDLYGNSVSSGDIFSKNKVTMVNIWASWCGPCVRELPELEALNQEFLEKGGEVIGILYDGSDEAAAEDARASAENAGVTYTVVLPWDGLEDVYPVRAFPTTFFVDSEGKIIGDPVVGAMPDQYREQMEALLGEAE